MTRRYKFRHSLTMLGILASMGIAAAAETAPAKSKPVSPAPVNASNPAPYASKPQLDRFWQAERKMTCKAVNKTQWEAWHKQAEKKLRDILGMDKMVQAPLQPRITEVKDQGDHIRQRVEIHTEADVIMPLFVLIPKTGETPFPAVIALHGHWSHGKSAVIGDDSVPGLAQYLKQCNYDYARQLVRNGFIVFCPDARGFGERREVKDQPGAPNLNGACTALNNQGCAFGLPLAGMMAFDNSRLIDYIETRPDCAKGGVGCAGLSGGGLQTLYLSALDSRVKCAVISGYFYGMKESLIDMVNCPCNYVPGLCEYFDMGDIASLIASRPLLIETGDEDPLNGPNGLKNVFTQIDIVRGSYELLSAKDRLHHDVFHGPHQWHGIQAIPWLKKFTPNR